MSTSLPLSILLVVLMAGAAAAQAPAGLPPPVSVEASLGDGSLSGLVLDEAGSALGGVSILATGTILAVARTDDRGRFALVLPAGEYLLRAALDGYLFNYKEPILVGPNHHLQRRIRLTRHLEAQTSGQPVPGTGQLQEPSVGPEDMHGHGEMAWRLRHLRRSVLRDESVVAALVQAPPPPQPRTLAGWVDRATTHTIRTAGSFFTDTEFTGHINLLATGAIDGTSRETSGDWSRGIANVFLGAPVGRVGDWAVRGAMAGGDASSWTVLGKYEAREDQRHAVRLSVSYSTQGFTPAGDLTMPVGLPESRSAGSLLAGDRWRVTPAISLDYGVRLDHYDYLSAPSLVSPHAAMAIEIRKGTTVRGASTERVMAPGADEFLPTVDHETWLPPVRTFLPLVAGTPLEPERTRRYVVGVDQHLGTDASSRVSLEFFNEATSNQMASLFGREAVGPVAPYFIATVGDVRIAGWRVGFDGAFSSRVKGRIEYTEGKARWSGTRAALRLLDEQSTVARRGQERISDLRGRLDVTFPSTATELGLVYQLTNLDPSFVRLPSFVDDGFDLQVRQKLPYQPLTSGQLHLMLAVSTIFHQHELVSLYDEVLTDSAPARLTAGIQVGF